MITTPLPWRLAAGAFLALTCWFNSEIWALNAVVTTTDGRQFVGEVESESPQEVVLLIAGIRTPILRDQIKNIEYQQSMEDQYQQRRQQINPTDTETRLELAKWLFEQKAYDLAKQELDELALSVSEHTPQNLRSQIELLGRAVAFRLSLQDRPAQPDGSTPQQGSTTTPTPPENLRPDEPKENQVLLADEQINEIKVYELPEDLLAAKPKVAVPPEVLNQFFEAYKDHPLVPKTPREQDKFRTRPGYEQLDLFFAVKAQDLYGKVVVREEPQALRTFRREIHRQYVLNYCGATSCHGTAGAPGMVLWRENAARPPVAYTNFFILQSTQVRGQPVLDRARPDSSLLLQYAMAPETVQDPHPDVPGWKPFVSPDSPMYRSVLEWIDSLWSPAPSYQFTYPLPAQGTRPAEENLKGDNAQP